MVAGFAVTVLGRGVGHGQHSGHGARRVGGKILGAAVGIAPGSGGFEQSQQRPRRRLPASRPEARQTFLDGRGEERDQPAPLSGKRRAGERLEQRLGLGRDPHREHPLAGEIPKRRGGHGAELGTRGEGSRVGLFLRRAHRLKQRVHMRLQNAGKQRGFVRIGTAEARGRNLHMPGEARKRSGGDTARGEQAKRRPAHLLLPLRARLGEPVLAQRLKIGRAVMDEVVVTFPGGLRLAARLDQRGRRILRRQRFLRQHWRCWHF
ncbi:MAG: hypothetical protein K6U10_06665 [Acidobacteriia bacterium]|nr:hypothetical protein [Methyloceanibacter sp.]MCL6491485.1 hypothetical protein [Terriglobia bacterium]